jgi:hypothetical protein
LAEAGVEMMVARLSGNFNAGPPSTPIVLGNGQISKITVSTVDAATKEILSEGRAANARKALKVQVQRTAAPFLQNVISSGGDFDPGQSVSVAGNLLVKGDLGGQHGITLTQAKMVLVGGDLDNNSGSIEMLPGGSLLVGGNLRNRHGMINNTGYLQVNGAIDNDSGTVVFSNGGAYYTPSTEYPTGTFVIQNGGRVPRLANPRENITTLLNTEYRIEPVGEEVESYRGYPPLDGQLQGNRYECNLTGKHAGTYYLDINALGDGDENNGGKDKEVQEIQLTGTYTGKWVIAVEGDVEIKGDLQPANADQDALVLLVDGTVSVNGNDNISAVIYAGRFKAGGSSTIRGTVVAQSFDVSGNVSLIQDEDLIWNVVPVLPPDLVTVKIISWREEYDVF